MTQVFASVAEDDDVFARLDRDRATRLAARAQVAANPNVTSLLSQIHDAYGDIDPSVAVKLAQAGIGPDDPIVEQLGKASAKKQSSSGFGWHSLGDAVSAAARLGDAVTGPVGDVFGHVVKAGARGVGLAAQSLWEEGEGVARNVASWDPGGIPIGGAIVGGLTTAALVAAAPIDVPLAIGAGVVAGGVALGAAGGTKVEGNARWEPQSSGAIALGRLLHGEKVELGHGYLPNVDANDTDQTTSIGEEQRQRASNIYLTAPDGRKLSLTPGRLLTRAVAEPGTQPFNTLSGLVDASLALSKYDPAAALGRTAGNFNRNRKLFVEAGGLLSHRPTILPEVARDWWTAQGDLRKVLAETSDFYDIWKATGGKLGARLTHQVANATTEAEVTDLILPRLGAEIRGKFGYQARRPFDTVRLLAEMPGTHIDPEDADHAVTTIERWMKNAKATPEQIAEATGRMAAQQTAIGRYGVLEEVMGTTKQILVNHGIDPREADRMVKLEEAANESTRAFNIDEIGNDVQVPGMFLDGEVHGTVSPHMPSEFINRTVTLPDVRDIRRATSGYARLFNNGLVKNGTATADFFQGQIWKKSALLRGAYTVRVIGEEQLRMAASGLDSLVNHPLSLIAMRIGRKGSEDAVGGEFKYRNAAEFAEGMDEHNQALNRGFAGWAEPRKTLPIWRRVKKGDADFIDAAASEIMQLASDPIGREVARNFDNLDAVKAAGWGAGATKLEDATTGLERIRIRMAEQAGGLRDRAVWDRYIDSIADRIRVKTGEHSDLIDTVATGKHAGRNVFDDQRFRPTEELKNFLGANVDDLYGDDAVMKLQMSLGERGTGAKLDKAVSYLFSNLMGERTNNLSRSPTFKQFYWQRAEELVPFMDEAAQDAVIAQARKVGLGDAADRMSAAAKRGSGRALADATPLNLEQADLVAKGHALDETKALLYDMSEKTQFFDAARLIFPFGEAWKEVLGRWARIGVERPQAYRRGQQIINGARQTGFFHVNENGEEVFNYPASDWVSDKLFGVKVPLTGRVGGLSLMTDVLPGVGPVTQISAGAFLPDAPEFDWMHNVLFPFGQPDTSHGVLEAFLPPWVNKFRQAAGGGADEAQFNGAVMDVSRYLVSTGKYDTSTTDGINRLLKDATKKAKYIYALRGAAQFFAPTAPTPEWLVKDKNGDALVAQKLIAEYHDLLAEDPQHATQAMLEKFGENVFLALQGKTAEVVAGAPITKEGANWERSHEGVVKSFPNVFGFFAPDEGGDLDSAAFDRQVSHHRRVPLTPDQAVRLANGRVANMIYQHAKDQVGPKTNAAQRTWLRQLRQALVTKYPGFGERVGVPESASVDTQVRELTDAVKDDRLDGNPAVKPIALYLQAREKAAAAGDTPTSFRQSQQMASTRTWLRAVASKIQDEYPEFTSVWERVFDRELADDIQTQEAAA